MINLLPPGVKQDILYARRNTKLAHWSIFAGVVLVGIAVVVGFGLVYLNQASKVYNDQLAVTTQQLELQKLDETQKRVQEISSSIKLVTQVLSREILFSKLVQQIGAAMPPNTTLTGLQIDKVQGGIDLSAQSVDYDTGSQIQVNLADPNNKIFEKADIVSITCGGGVSSGSKYNCQVQIRALFAKNNPFLFINSKGTKP